MKCDCCTIGRTGSGESPARRREPAGSSTSQSRRRVTESILHRVAAGDPAAVPECMERFGGLVWSVARRYCPSATDAEDAVQEIFIDLWKSAARFDASIASETTFVAMIARRRLIDRSRRRARRPEAAMIVETIVVPSEPMGERAAISEDARLATAALAQLRPEQQRVLQLSIFHGASHEQISRSTGMPLGTVKTHARRGLIRIRELLEESKSGLGGTASAGRNGSRNGPSAAPRDGGVS